MFGKDKIKDLSLIPVIQDTIIATSGNSLKEFKSIDRDNTEQLLSSELQMSKYIKTDENFGTGIWAGIWGRWLNPEKGKRNVPKSRVSPNPRRSKFWAFR